MRLFLLSCLFVVAVAAPAHAALNVVGTLPDFAALASELGGARVTAGALIKGTQDPHFADAKPSMILAVNRADLLITIGMGLEEGWLPVLITQSRNPKIQPGKPGHLDASAYITPKEVTAKPDRAMGDVHGQGNPHYYTSPEELHKVARAISARLIELDPAGRAEYETRLSAFEATYAKKSAEWRGRLAALKGAKVIEYHKSWIYLLDWAGLTGIGALEPVPGVPPSPSHVAALIAKVADQKVRCIIQEIYQPQSLSRVFAQKTGAKLLVLPAMVGAEPQIVTFWDKFDRLTTLLTANQ